MKTLTKLIILTSTLVLIIGCRSDIRTKLVKNEKLSTDHVAKGKAILESAWKAQGFNKLHNHQVYSYQAYDVWKGVMGTVGKLWPDKKMTMDFKYEIGSFNGQVQYASSKHKGQIKGLQNWNYYEIDSDTTFMKPNPKVQFGLSAFQYFTEMIDRLKNAPIVVYAGEDEMRGVKYDLVLCTWNSLEPSKHVDQYIAWINKKTGLMDFTQYTIRENYLNMPGAKILYGGVEYSNLKSVDGLLIPHTQTIYAFNLKDNTKRFIHKLDISNFEFDAFPVEELQIDKTIARGGDFKQ